MALSQEELFSILVGFKITKFLYNKTNKTGSEEGLVFGWSSVYLFLFFLLQFWHFRFIDILRDFFSK